MPDPILIPGAGPVSALINAHDVLRLLDDEWLGEVHFPDADSDDSGSTELPILDDASVGTLAEEILRFGAIERRVALGPVRRVKQDNFTAWLCALSIEGIENQRMIQGHDQLAAIQMALMLLLSHIHKGGALSKRKPTHDAQFDSESES